MKNLIRKVSHNSRCAPFRTVNFARKPRRPVASTAGTVSSGAIAALIAWPTAFGFRLQHVRDKFASVEGREIVQLFAGADKARWNSKFILNRDDDSALADTIELGDDEASQFDCVLEFARPVERVAARWCINHQQGFIRPNDEQHRYHLQETTCDEAKHVFVKPLRELQRYKRYIGDDSLWPRNPVIFVTVMSAVFGASPTLFLNHLGMIAGSGGSFSDRKSFRRPRELPRRENSAPVLASKDKRPRSHRR